MILTFQLLERRTFIRSERLGGFLIFRARVRGPFLLSPPSTQVAGLLTMSPGFSPDGRRSIQGTLRVTTTHGRSMFVSTKVGRHSHEQHDERTKECDQLRPRRFSQLLRSSEGQNDLSVP